MTIAVINYDQGNLFSIINALKFFNLNFIVTNKKTEIQNCSQILIPGVGAYDKTIKSLERLNLLEVIKKEAYNKKKIVGICVGMQILSDNGNEGEWTEGLGLIKGQVERLPITKGLKIPNINWQKLRYNDQTSAYNSEMVYFLHSYFMRTEDKNIVSYINYGDLKVPAIVKCMNVWGIQFHPEKSGKIGLAILKEILEK